MDLYYALFPGEKIKEQAFETNCKASVKKAEAMAQVEKNQALFQASVVKLRDRKLGIINTSFADFVGLYEKISRINFKPSDGLSELSTLTFPPELYEIHRGVSAAPAIPLTNGQETMAFLKGSFIAGLFGGGAVGGFFFGMREIDKREANQSLATAQANRKTANVVAAQCELEVTALQGLTEKLNRISALLTKLNMLFRTAIARSGEAIDSTGCDRSKYSTDQIELLRSTISLAQTIKAIIDQPILNEQDKVSAEAMNALASGEQIYEQMQNALSTL